MPHVPGAVRDAPKKYGLLTVAAGLALLIGLRLWASPLTMEITGRSRNGLVEFLLIPVFLAVVGLGVMLFLWEPDSNHA